MKREILLGAGLILCLGCQSPGSWNPFAGPGYRVPPPPTGSYGGPNSYYQPSVPATTPPVGSKPALNRWSSVPVDSAQLTSADTAPSITPSSAATGSATVSAGGPRSIKGSLNGMNANQVRTASEPGRFTPADNVGELKPDSVISRSRDTNAVRSAGATQSSTSSSGGVSSATWQSRSSDSRFSTSR